MAESSPFPVPEDADTEDIAWALETAGALWARGDAREAIRWIRRAAESASDNGLDMRAVELARNAADLATELQIPPSIPPPPMEEAPAGTIPDPTAVSPVDANTRRGTLETAAMSPEMADMAYDRRTSPDVGVPQAPEQDEPSAPATKASEPPGRWSDSEPTIADHEESTVRGATPSDEESAKRPRSIAGGRTRQALRVAVTPSDERGLLLARVLAENEPTPAGAHEAMLVALEAGAHLLSKKR